MDLVFELYVGAGPLVDAGQRQHGGSQAHQPNRGYGGRCSSDGLEDGRNRVVGMAQVPDRHGVRSAAGNDRGSHQRKDRTEGKIAPTPHKPQQGESGDEIRNGDEGIRYSVEAQQSGAPQSGKFMRLNISGAEKLSKKNHPFLQRAGRPEFFANKKAAKERTSPAKASRFWIAKKAHAALRSRFTGRGASIVSLGAGMSRSRRGAMTRTAIGARARQNEQLPVQDQFPEAG